MKLLISILASTTGLAAILAASSALVLDKYDTGSQAFAPGSDTFVLGVVAPANPNPDR